MRINNRDSLTLSDFRHVVLACCALVNSDQRVEAVHVVLGHPVHRDESWHVNQIARLHDCDCSLNGNDVLLRSTRDRNDGIATATNGEGDLA